MQRLYRTTFVYFIGSILSRFVGFLLLPLYTNVLTPEDFGDYSLLMAIYAVLNVICQAGLLQGFTKYFFEKDYQQREVVSTSFNLLFVYGLLLAWVLTAFAKPLSSVLLTDQSLHRLLLMVIWMLFIDSLAFFGLHLLKTERRARAVVSHTVVTAIVNLLLNAIFLLVFKLGISGIFLAQMISGGVLFSLCSKAVFKNYRLYIDLLLAKRLVKFSFPLVIAGLFGILMDVADRFLIDIYLNRSMVGIYSVAYKAGLLMNVFLIAFRTAFLPSMLSEKDSQKLPEHLNSVYLKLIALLCIIFVGIVFFIPAIFNLRIGSFTLINPDFHQAIPVIPFVLLGYAFAGMATFFSLSPYLSGKSYHFAVADFLGLAVNIALNIALIPLIGLIGAAIATLCGFYVVNSYMFVIFNRAMTFDYKVSETLLIVGGALLTLYAGSISSLLVFKLPLLAGFIFFCLRVVKLSFKDLMKLSF